MPLSVASAWELAPSAGQQGLAVKGDGAVVVAIAVDSLITRSSAIPTAPARFFTGRLLNPKTGLSTQEALEQRLALIGKESLLAITPVDRLRSKPAPGEASAQGSIPQINDQE